MKKIDKFIAVGMAAIMCLGITACGSSNTAPAENTAESAAVETEGAADSSAAESPDGESYTIGICQLVQHEALDQGCSYGNFRRQCNI